MGLVTFKVFNSAMDAHLLKSKLEAEGIRCYLVNELSSTMHLAFLAGGGGIRLQIGEQHVDRAFEIVRKIQKQPHTDDNDIPLTCPNCKSTDIISGINSIKGIRGVLAMLSLFFFMILMIPQKAVYKCNSCNKEFNIK